MQRLIFRGLSLASDTEVDLVLDADDGTTVTWRFTLTEHRGIGVINGPDEFTNTYRQVPGPSFATWPEQLVRQAFEARREPMPAGSAAHGAIEDARADLQRRWDGRRSD